MTRTCLTILALAALAACESGTALQLVSARVSSAGFAETPNGIGAWSGGELLGWSPLDAGGAGLLALPAADRIELSLTDHAGRPIARVEARPGVVLELRICRPGKETFDLGEVRHNADRCRPPPECRGEWDDLHICQERIEDDDCVVCPPDDLCDELRSDLAFCMGGRDMHCEEGPPVAMAQRGPPPGGIGCRDAP